MTADERARAAIGRALAELLRETADAPLPADMTAMLDRLGSSAPPPSPTPARKPFWRR